MPKNTLYQKYEAGSFPSIHTARIAAVSMFFIRFYSGVLPATLGILATTVVGCSRVYLRKHYAIDVIAGVLIGVAFGVLLK